MATKKKKAKTTKPSTKKKVPLKKKKVATKKSVATKKKLAKWVNPHVGYRYFLIDVGGRGGDLKVNTASKEFVEYWLREDAGSVTDHIYAMHEKAMGHDYEDEDDDVEEQEYEGYDSNSPEINPGRGDVEYWNLDDIEGGIFVSSEYNDMNVVEIIPHEETIYGKYGNSLDWEDRFTKKRNFDWSKPKYTTVGEPKSVSFDRVVYSRELLIEDTDKDIIKAGTEAVPAIMIYDSQKGTFGQLLIRTKGEDFDPKKFAYTVCENNMGDHITQYFYDKAALDFNTDSLSTWGKGFDAIVGYLHKWDVEHDYEACLKEGWEELEESK